MTITWKNNFEELSNEKNEGMEEEEEWRDIVEKSHRVVQKMY